MGPISRLGKQLAEVTALLASIDTPYALIGGLALASHNVIRATQDIDLLIALEKADEVDAELIKLGYSCLHRSVNAGNYARGAERVDFLYASRPVARRLLDDARELATSLGTIRVIGLEGLIGFKLQPEQPLAAGGGIVVPVTGDDDPYRTLDELMVVVEALCPQWPERGIFVTSGQMLL